MNTGLWNMGSGLGPSGRPGMTPCCAVFDKGASRGEEFGEILLGRYEAAGQPGFVRLTAEGVDHRAVRREAVGMEIGAHHRLGLRSEEHTSELQSLRHLVCRLLLEKKTRKQP